MLVKEIVWFAWALLKNVPELPLFTLSIQELVPSFYYDFPGSRIFHMSFSQENYLRTNVPTDFGKTTSKQGLTSNTANPFQFSFLLGPWLTPVLTLFVFSHTFYFNYSVLIPLLTNLFLHVFIFITHPFTHSIRNITLNLPPSLLLFWNVFLLLSLLTSENRCCNPKLKIYEAFFPRWILIPLWLRVII